MPVSVAETVADRLFEQLFPNRRPALPGWDRHVFILDGSSVETPHTPELVKAYPPASNQHGQSHWPIVKFVSAHEFTTGISVRPCWGPMYGPKAVSEQALTEELLPRLPEASVVMGDINFGVFSVAFAAKQAGHDSLIRLHPDRVKAMARSLTIPLQPGTDVSFCWQPSPCDLRAHPGLSAGDCVQGRLIFARVRASDGQSVDLFFFSTLNSTSAP